MSVRPVKELNLVAGGRFDHFNQFGDIWTYRFAGSYLISRTDTTLHASIATGFSPPSSQDKIFGNNFELEPEKNRGWDAGVEQRLWNGRVQIGATYFHNRLSNVIGFNGLFDTLNLGAARTQGLEAELKIRPIAESGIDGELHLSRRRKNLRRGPISRRARACLDGRETKLTSRRHISGSANCARRRKRNSSMRAKS